MKYITILFGIILAVLGVANYIAAGMESLFALMPALFGILIILFGILQGRWDHRHALFGSLLLAALTLVGSLRGIWNLFVLLTGGEPAIPAQEIAVRSTMGLFCLLFIGLGLLLISDFWTGWKAFGHFLGDWLARVVLTIFYFTVLIPFGIGVRLFADPLQIKHHPEKLWRERTTGDRALEDVLRQF